MELSVVVPAHNEEAYLGRCLFSIRRAADRASARVETIVVANRCTDRTAAIAREGGARIVENRDRCLAKIRNDGARAARGDVLVTIDADSAMAPNTLAAIERALGSGRYVGGGAAIRFDRYSAGIRLSYALVQLLVWAAGLGGGLYWCRKADFDAIGGFDESLLLGEDLDFARRLRDHGRAAGRSFRNLVNAPITTSTRKFDRFGDWHFLRLLLQPRRLRGAMNGTDRTLPDELFYDFNS